MNNVIHGASGLKYVVPDIPNGPLENGVGFVPTSVAAQPFWEPATKYNNVGDVVRAAMNTGPEDTVQVRDGDEVVFTFPGSISTAALDRAIDFLQRLKAVKG